MRRGPGAGVAAAFAAVWVIWGSTYLAIAWAVETVPPLMMIGLRCVTAGAVLYGWSRVRGGPRPGAADWRAAAVAGVLLFVTGQAVLAWAETRIPSGVASLLIAIEPLFVALLAWRASTSAAANTAAPRPANVAAIATGFVGVGVLVLPGTGDVRLDPVAAGAVVLAALSWSVGIFRAGSRPGMGAAQTAGMQLLAAGGPLLGLSLGVGELGALPSAGPSARSLLALGYLVVFGSIVGFGAYVWLLGQVSAQHVSTHAYVNPLVAVALGAALNGEALTPEVFVAGALILGSVALLLGQEASSPEISGGRHSGRGGAQSAELLRPLRNDQALHGAPDGAPLVAQTALGEADAVRLDARDGVEADPLALRVAV